MDMRPLARPLVRQDEPRRGERCPHTEYPAITLWEVACHQSPHQSVKANWPGRFRVRFSFAQQRQTRGKRYAVIRRAVCQTAPDAGRLPTGIAGKSEHQ